jgi:hypothetical protein
VGKACLVALTGLVLAACSLRPGEPRPLEASHWLHESKKADDFERDQYDCRRENPSVRRNTAAALRDQCMRARGWRRLIN